MTDRCLQLADRVVSLLTDLDSNHKPDPVEVKYRAELARDLERAVQMANAISVMVKGYVPVSGRL